MKRLHKLSGLIAAAALLATALVPVHSFALTTGTLSASASTTQTNGSFTVTIYEGSDDAVNYADAEFSVSGAVSNVSVQVTSPFSSTGAPCAAAYCAIGGSTGAGVSGTGNTLAVVHFTLANPGSASIVFDASSSLKHAVGTTLTSIHPATSSGTYTYSAPVATTPTAPTTGGSTSTGSSTSSSSTKTTTPTSTSKTGTSTPTTPVATTTNNGSSNSKSSQNSKHTPAPKAKQIKSRHSGFVTSTVSALVVIAVAFYWLVIRKRVELKPMAAVYKLAGRGKKVDATPAKKTASTSKSTTTRKPAAKKTK